MNIVCGTDFRDAAQTGATVAAALARMLDDRLLLVHALPGGGLGALAPDVMNVIFTTLQGMLAEEAARLGPLGAEVEPHLATGYPAPALLSVVSPGPTRLVVVGSPARRGAKPRLVGGVAERVAESSPFPTLVVRQHEPFVQWVRGERPLRIVCAYDFSPAADAALARLNELRRWGPCELVVAQVDYPPEERARLGLPGPALVDGNEPEMQRMLEWDPLCGGEGRL